MNGCGRLSRGMWSWSAVCLLAVASLTGCTPSEPMGQVAGTVTLDGKPYSDSSVMLLSPETGRGGGADIQSDGTFQLPDPLPTGTYNAYLAPKSVPVDAAPTPVTIDKAVPEKYWNESTTDITVTVSEGENNVQIELLSR